MKNKLCVLLCILVTAVTLCACQNAEVEGPTQVTARHETAENVAIDYSLTELPVFVEDISQCTDWEKQYVLPDGYLYEPGMTFVPDATNQLLLATDVDGSLFNDCGYRDNARIREILEIGESDFSFVTGFIPVQAGDTIFFGGSCFMPEYENAQYMHTTLYDADKKVIGQTSMQKAADTLFDVLETNEQGYVASMQVNAERAPGGLAYIRFTLIGVGSGKVISVNESLSEGSEGLTWVPKEQYVPAAWCEEVRATVESVNNIPLSDPAASTRFVLVTDIHVDPDPKNSYTGNLGKVSAEVMRACSIPFFATAGDNCTQSSGFKPSDFSENMETVLEQLSPIPQQNILLTVGNHDGATGSREINGETVYYRYQLNNEERSAVFFDWQRESNGNKHFDSDGTYYYLDDEATKTRYILLNSFWSEWEGEKDGFVPDIQHGFMQSPHFGSQQLHWFAEVALDMPSEYGAIIITHFAPAAKDFEVFKGIVDAYSNQSIYQGSYIGEQEWQNTEIAVNYDYAKGEIIAVFQGHNHEDALGDYFQRVPCINVTTAGAYWAVRGEDAVQRVCGTATEFAADVIVVDRKSRTIYLTRLGAGADRTVSY